MTTPHCLAPAVDANALGTAKTAKDAKREKAYWRRNGFSRFFASYGEARSMTNDLGLTLLAQGEWRMSCAMVSVGIR